MKSIDLYSGIGGWTLGMKLSGVQHVKSYEWLKVSNTTHNNNFNSSNSEIDIRKMNESDLPDPGTIDFVVGSPPCTQFSYSNKGGKGDIEDGLIDIYKFFEVVEYLKPKYWVMENVPRVSKIINEIVRDIDRFKKFRGLFNFNEVIDFSDYGVPQKRKRTICGNFPYKLFIDYQKHCPKRTLGDVVNSLKGEVITDPIFGYTYPSKDISDHLIEEPLNGEELRMNRESKTFHPIYNNMKFPEDYNLPSRTITSTCTRVSRESSIIEDNGGYRRLTIRERGCLQGFPITFNFFGNSYSSKQKMIGNSIPPVVTYFLFQSMLETKPKDLIPVKSITSYQHPTPKNPVIITPPDGTKGKYRHDRSFKLSIPRLRFGSGVRFELSNNKIDSELDWSVRFFYGGSKNIIEMDFLSGRVKNFLENLHIDSVTPFLDEFRIFCKDISSNSLQNSWSHITDKNIHPYKVLDKLGEYLDFIIPLINSDEISDLEYEGIFQKGMNKKLYNLKSEVVSGILMGIVFNEER
jgi:DNA (cytosine-5)-methyltransferase 1